MVNMPRRLTGLPMVIYCSARNAPHDIRIKVSPIHGDRMIENEAISVAVRPEPHYPDEESRRLPPGDFESVAAWIRQNQDVIVEYWDQRIDTGEFRRRVAERTVGGRSGPPRGKFRKR